MVRITWLLIFMTKSDAASFLSYVWNDQVSEVYIVSSHLLFSTRACISFLGLLVCREEPCNSSEDEVVSTSIRR
jgi:hypothetical protein